MEQHQHLFWIGNVASAGAIITALAGILPPIGALAALIWYVVQIMESNTYKTWSSRRRARKIVKLRARLLELEAMNIIDPAKGGD